MHAPVWFRYGVIASATLMLCSCKATLPSRSTASSAAVDTALGEPLAQTNTATEFQTRGIDRHIDRQLMPVIYRQDSHTAPPAIRRAEYAAGVRPAGCPCANHGGYGHGSYEPQGCNNGCSSGCAIVGPRDEYLCDGGDDGLTVGIRKDWQVDGLEQEDTIAHYDTVDGRTIVTPSNQVCIYAPRFGVVRRMVDLHEYARSDSAGGFDSPLVLSKIDENERASTSLAQLEPTIHRVGDPATLMRKRQQLGEIERAMVIEEIDGSLAPYADLKIVQTGTIDNGEKALLARASLAAITWAGDQSPQITIDERHAQASVRDAQPGIVYHLHDPKKPHLRLIKLASTGAAKPGEEIEFTLRFDNIGSQGIGNVTIMDNLTTRLEYVEDSAKSSVEADFSTKPNSGGSVILRWEITEPIEAGEGGILQFKCKVR